MLIELLALGGASLGTLLSWAGKEVNSDMEDEINDINDKISKLSDKAESKAKATAVRCDKALKRLSEQRKEVMDTTITEFADKAKKIKNIQFGANIPVVGKVNEINPKLYRDCSNYVHTFLAGDMGIIGGIGLHLINYIRLDRIKEETEANYSKMQAQYEMVKKECVKINSITKLCKTTFDTVETLKAIADLAIEEMSRILNQKGSDYLEYNQEEQGQIYFTFSVVGALAKLCATEIVKEDGEVNDEFKKFVGEVSSNYLEGGTANE